MRHHLGPFSFTVPASWRDDSTYAFDSPDGAGSALFQTGDEAPDAAALLATARKRYEDVIQALLIYSNSLAVTLRNGTAVPAAEGEQRDMNGGSKNERFAMAPLVSGRRKFLLVVVARSNPGFLKFFRQLARTISFAGDAEEARPDAIPGWTQRQASHVLFELPADWRGPPSLRFLARDSDRVVVRISVAEPKAAEGSIEPSLEVPGRWRVLAHRTMEVTSPGLTGWAGEWSVERDDGSSFRSVMRKASLVTGAGDVVTLHGNAPAADAPSLDVAWNMLRSSLQPSGRRT